MNEFWQTLNKRMAAVEDRIKSLEQLASENSAYQDGVDDHLGEMGGRLKSLEKRANNGTAVEPVRRLPRSAVQDSEIPNRAPRVTLADIRAAICDEFYFTGAQAIGGSHNIPANSIDLHVSVKLLTICILVLSNGCTVVGTSACASPANFNAKIGRRIARQDAVRQVWPLLDYALRDRLANGAATQPA